VKKIGDWWFPDHEEHFIEWMAIPKNKVHLNGRLAYQGRKQLAVLSHCSVRRVAVDVGGHIGTWSWNLSAVFGMVHAFEPVKEHRLCFVKNLEGVNNVKLYGVALGAAPGEITIKTTKGSSGDSQVHPGQGIEMKTLDSFELFDVNLIKIDCEGYEENVLRGAAETIRQSQPTIVVEQKRDMAERFGLEKLGAVHLLESWGYKVVQEYSGDFIMRKM
jgi:FkbM family methyltransferase